MTKIAIVYFSGSGHTHLMAEAIGQGASSVAGKQVELHRILGSQIVEGRWKDEEIVHALGAADAIIFGSPTYMGGVAAQLKAFLDGVSNIWYTQGWKDKVAGGFTHSGSPSGDKQGTLLYLSIYAAQHSMLWVGNAEAKTDTVNRLGSYLGVMGQSAPDYSGAAVSIDEGDRATSELYGRRLAQATQRWQIG
jgi:NAD(P)H dehydrogenase (quinone)